MTNVHLELDVGLQKWTKGILVGGKGIVHKLQSTAVCWSNLVTNTTDAWQEAGPNGSELTLEEGKWKYEREVEWLCTIMVQFLIAVIYEKYWDGTLFKFVEMVDMYCWDLNHRNASVGHAQSSANKDQLPTLLDASNMWLVLTFYW